MNHDSIHAIQLFGSTKYFRLTWVSRKGNLKFDALSACVPLDFFIGIIHLSSDTPIYLYIILYYIYYIILYYIILYYIILYYIILYYIILYIYIIFIAYHVVKIAMMSQFVIYHPFFFSVDSFSSRSLSNIQQVCEACNEFCKTCTLVAEASEGELVFFGCLVVSNMNVFCFFSIIYGIMMVNDG